jgi:hypothetical protein
MIFLVIKGNILEVTNMAQNKKGKENKGKGKGNETKEVKSPGIFSRILDTLRNLWAKIISLFTRIF